jgi:hypothetical protein
MARVRYGVIPTRKKIRTITLPRHLDKWLTDHYQKTGRNAAEMISIALEWYVREVLREEIKI